MVWIVITHKSLISVNPVQKERAIIHHSNLLPRNEQCRFLNWYTVMCVGRGEYFVTFIDDHTRYAWIYILKRKDEEFQRFCEWKALVEKTSSRKIKPFVLIMEVSTLQLSLPPT